MWFGPLAETPISHSFILALMLTIQVKWVTLDIIHLIGQFLAAVLIRVLLGSSLSLKMQKANFKIR